jgi:hypothetical protein
LHTFKHYRQEKERKRKREGKNTGKKLRVRAISSENVVIVVCAVKLHTMDCQEKPESNKKRQEGEKETTEGGLDFLST